MLDIRRELLAAANFLDSSDNIALLKCLYGFCANGLNALHYEECKETNESAENYEGEQQRVVNEIVVFFLQKKNGI